jgi:uncharacterized membrane-anchored protein
MLKAPFRILIVAALCIIALVSLVVRESMARAAGTEVLLAMEAVDPRALLSGHYVIIALQETSPGGCGPPASVDDDMERELASYRWLALGQNDTTHTVTGTGKTREEALAKGGVAVLGTADCIDMFGPANEVSGSVTRLDLGISRFHINQADAERIDRLLRAQTGGEAQRIFAIVSIGEDGRARLKGLQVDGERLDLNWL